jgi:hypothetical protein
MDYSDTMLGVLNEYLRNDVFMLSYRSQFVEVLKDLSSVGQANRLIDSISEKNISSDRKGTTERMRWLRKLIKERIPTGPNYCQPDIRFISHQTLRKKLVNTILKLLEDYTPMEIWCLIDERACRWNWDLHDFILRRIKMESLYDLSFQRKRERTTEYSKNIYFLQLL